MINDLLVLSSEISHDDSTLVRMYYKSFNDFKTKKKAFDKELNCVNENNYLSVAVAKLAYAFAKEEYDLLFSEAKRRGLIV